MIPGVKQSTADSERQLMQKCQIYLQVLMLLLCLCCWLIWIKKKIYIYILENTEKYITLAKS